MSGGRFVPATFVAQVREKVRRLVVTHPEVRVGPRDTVLRVFVRDPRRSRRRGHSGHRTLTRLVAALGLIAGFLALAPSPPAAVAADGDGTTFTVGLTDKVDSLNPFLGVLANSYEMWALTYNFMVGYSMKDMSPQPELAEKWETSTDGKTWTFHIRDGVKWTDGQPLTAADIAYTYNRVMKGTIESSNWSSYLTNVTSVTAPDPATVVLKLSKPNAVLPLLPIPILPEHIWKDVSEKEMKSYGNEPSPGKPVVGSGPFILVEGKTGGSTYKFEANKDYWDGAPHVDKVDFRVFNTQDPAVQALIKGEIDFVDDITALQVKSLKDKEGITARDNLSPLFEEIGFNTGAVDTKTEKPIGDANPAVLDPKFRHALGYAVDLDKIVKSAFQGAAVAGTTVVPSPYSTWHWDPPDDEKFTFDLDRAGQLLDEAGYKKGGDGKRTMPNGKPIGALRLFARSDSEFSVTIMDYFKEWLGELGIDSKVTAMDSGKLGEVILDGEYDVFQWDWYVEPDPDGILADFTCDQRGGLSDSWYCDKSYDAMYTEQNGEMDKAKRVEIVKAMQKKLYDDAPYIVVAETTQGQAVRTDRFACFQPQPDPDGVWLIQYGGHNYNQIRPASQAGDCDGVASALGANQSDSSGSSSSDDGGGGAAVWIGAAVLAVAVVGGGVVLMRRRGTAAERE
jgi:peptide/nickel transport system substrate-binding protein